MPSNIPDIRACNRNGSHESVPVVENDRSSSLWKPSPRWASEFHQSPRAPPSAWSSSNRAPSSRRFARSDCIVWTLLPHRSDSESPVTSSSWKGKDRGEIAIPRFFRPARRSTVYRISHALPKHVIKHEALFRFGSRVTCNVQERRLLGTYIRIISSSLSN